MAWWENLPQASPLDVALQQEGITGPFAELAQSIYTQESSGGRNTKTSNAGAVGGMQILPGTFNEVADEGWDINDPVQNARAGVRYLRKMYELGGEDQRMAAVGYYGGPGAIKAAQQGQARSDPRNPNAPDTFGYADQVLSRLVPTAQADSLDNWWENLERVDEPADTGNWWEQLESVDAMTPEQQEPDNRSLMGDVGRQLGLTARYGLEGLADAAGIVTEPIRHGLNVGLRAAGIDEARPLGEMASKAADYVGLPQPETATERVVGDASRLMAGVGGIGGASNLAARGLTGTGQAVAQQMGAGMGQQVAGAAGAGLGAGATREAGFGEGAQLAAALGGGLLASSAVGRAGRASSKPRGMSADTKNLQDRARSLYEQAESRGVRAEPAQTSQLGSDMRNLAAAEGLITPSGALVDGYPKLGGVMRMLDEYAGQEMTGRQMQSIRRLLSNAAGSPDRAESRIGTMMIRAFDDFTAPLAPELAEARNLYAASMRGRQLETLREVAENRASQYSQSGLENALRAEYRKLSNRISRGQERGWTPEQVEAINRVGRGTAPANIARMGGKLAPTGVVSAGFSGGVPFMIGNAIGGPAVGAAAAGGTLGIGALSRNAATALTSRNAAIAEALARGMPLTSQATPTLTNPMGALYGAALMSER